MLSKAKHSQLHAAWLHKRIWPYAAYFALAIAILPALLHPGYIFALDMVFPTRVPMPDHVSSSYLFYSLLHALGAVLPGWVLQKFVLLAALILPGIGMHRLMLVLKPARMRNWTAACYSAGILYVCNPFVYSRLVSGQYAVLLGYGLLPFVARAAWLYNKAPSLRKAAIIAALFTLIGVASIHSLGFAALLVIAFSAPYIWLQRHNGAWLGPWLRGIALAAVGFVAASSYWLLPLIRGTSTTAQQINSFSAGDAHAFATSAQNIGIFGNILSLQGFWADARNLYMVPRDVYSWWLIPVVALWIIVIAGGIISWRHSRAVTFVMLSVILAATIAATGTTDTIFAPINRAIGTAFPLYKGYREPQKFVGLIALCYAYFGGYFVAWLASRKQALVRHSVILLAVLPIALNPLLLMNANGHLSSVNYPSDWYTAKQLLPPNGKVLLLPWHAYLSFDFTGHVIGNPEQFFEAQTISSADPELPGVRSADPNTIQATIESSVLPALESNTDITPTLTAHAIQYIVVYKNTPYKSAYAQIKQQTKLTNVHDSTNIAVFKVVN